MTETKKKFESIVSAKPTASYKNSGKPTADVVLKSLLVNNHPTMRTLSNGSTVFSFPSSISGDFSKSRLERSLNNIQLPTSDFGVSLNVSLFVNGNAKQVAYVSERLVKGAKIDIPVGIIYWDSYEKDGEIHHSLKGNFNAMEIAGIFSLDGTSPNSTSSESSYSDTNSVPDISEEDLPF